jgi:hypothetical protein
VNQPGGLIQQQRVTEGDHPTDIVAEVLKLETRSGRERPGVGLVATADIASIREVRRRLNGTPAELDALFTAMTGSSAFDGVVANIGASFLGKLEAGGRELQGILSTAQEQTAPLDDIVRITERSDFRLR